MSKQPHNFSFTRSAAGLKLGEIKAMSSGIGTGKSKLVNNSNSEKDLVTLEKKFDNLNGVTDG